MYNDCMHTTPITPTLRHHKLVLIPSLVSRGTAGSSIPHHIHPCVYVLQNTQHSRRGVNTPRERGGLVRQWEGMLYTCLGFIDRGKQAEWKRDSPDSLLTHFLIH